MGHQSLGSPIYGRCTALDLLALEPATWGDDQAPKYPARPESVSRCIWRPSESRLSLFLKAPAFSHRCHGKPGWQFIPAKANWAAHWLVETAAKLPGSSPIHMKNVGSVGAPGKSEWIRFEHVFFDVILVSVFSLKFSHHKSSSASLQRTSSGRFESCEDKTETA